MPPVETVPPGTNVETGPQQPTGPRNQLNPNEGLYTIRTPVNFVLLPVMVKDKDGRRVDGLLPSDFVVLENGKQQKLSYFTSDPFLLSVAVVLDVGMADVALQKVNQTYSALVGAFSPYDEFALYTYSSTVTRVTDFTGRPEKLTAALDAMKIGAGRQLRAAGAGRSAGRTAPYDQWHPGRNPRAPAGDDSAAKKRTC